MVRSDLKDQKLLVSSMEHIGYKLANLGNAKNAGKVHVTESGVNANETGKYMNKDMKFKNRIRVSNIIVAKSSDIFIESLKDFEGLEGTYKITKTDLIATKSLDVSVRDLEGVFKIVEIDAVTAKSLDISIWGLGGVRS